MFWIRWLMGLLLASSTEAQMPPEARLAAPLLQLFGPDEYQAHGQNWGFLQLDDGRMLVVNNRGIVIYDGAHFDRVIPGDGFLPDGVLRDDSGRIFVIAEGELGELLPDGDAGFDYVALLDATDLGGRQRLGAALAQQGLWLLTNRSLLLYRNDRIEPVVEQAEDSFRQLYAIGGRLLVLHRDEGLLSLVDGRLVPVLSHPALLDQSRVTLLPIGSERLLLLSATGQSLMLEWIGDRLEPRDAASWTAALQMIERLYVYSSLVLSDGRLAVATIRAGVLVFNPDGTLDARIDAVNGLPVDTVLGLAEDREGGLWIATVAGFARAAIHHPIRRFDDRHNLRFLIHAVQRVQGELRIASSAGAFRFMDRRFQPVNEGTSQVWRLDGTDQPGEPGGLLLSTDTGLVWIRDGQSRTLIPDQVGFSLMRAGPGQWLNGMGQGLYSVCWNGQDWQVEQVPTISGATRSLALAPDGAIWAGTLDRAAYRIEGLAGNCGVAAEDLSITRFDQTRGLPASNYAEVYLLGGKLRIGTRFGIFRPDAAGENLVPDDEFESRLRDGSLGWFVAGEDSSGRVFAQLLEGDRRWTEVIERGDDGIYRSKPERLGKFGALRAEGYVPSGDGMWIHGASEIWWVDVGRMKDPGALAVAPLVRALGETEGEPLRLDGRELADEQRALRFEFALPLYDFPESRQWRSRLIGFDRDWSDWSSTDTRVYTNLPGGDYRLEVQARDGLGRESPIRGGEFSVARVWYLRTPALILWVLATMLLLLLVARIGRVGLAARNRQLERVIAERTEEIRRQRDRLEAMAHRDALTGLPNRRDMYRRLGDALSSTRTADAAMTLMAIDLNEFKQINDRFGHPAGDQVLKQVADTLASHMRTGDVVFRPGGDEFVVMASNLAAGAAMERADELIRAVAETGFDEFAPGLKVSISVGVASVQAPVSWEAVLEQADQALYRAKRDGAGPVLVVNPEASSNIGKGRSE